MPSFNQIHLMGHLTRDIEMSFLPSNMAVAKFGMAINHKWTTQGGEKKEEVCFVDCVAFGKTGEVINQYCKKGDALFVVGRLRYETWEAKDGTKRSKHSVTVDKFQFVGGKKSDATPDKDEPGGDDAPW